MSKILIDILQHFKRKPIPQTPKCEILDPFLDIEMDLGHNDDYLEQRSSSCGSDPRSSIAIRQKGYSMKIKKGTRKIVIFQYLLSKFIFDFDGLHLDEYIVLYELYLLLCDEKDPNFQRKYGEDLMKIKFLIIKISGVEHFPLRMKNGLEDRRTIAQICGKVCLTEHAYYGMRGNRNICDSFRISINFFREPQRLPAKQFIGVGYKDKGSRREPSFDGSPRWQEIGQEYCEMENALQEFLEGLNSSNESDGPIPLQEE